MIVASFETPTCQPIKLIEGLFSNMFSFSPSQLIIHGESAVRCTCSTIECNNLIQIQIQRCTAIQCNKFIKIQQCTTIQCNNLIHISHGWISSPREGIFLLDQLYLNTWTEMGLRAAQKSPAEACPCTWLQMVRIKPCQQ